MKYLVVLAFEIIGYYLLYKFNAYVCLGVFLIMFAQNLGNSFAYKKKEND